MENNPSEHNSCGKNCPVENVSWNDVQKFIEKLNQKEETKKYRLPTDDEWEYACRAGSTTKYFFGEDESSLKDYAWYDENSNDMPHPAGSLKPNAWGLYDMHGNIWEWVQDSDYSSESIDTSIGLEIGSFRIKRGGSYFSDPSRVRSANRAKINPDNHVQDVGFRLAMFLGKE